MSSTCCIWTAGICGRARCATARRCWSELADWRRHAPLQRRIIEGDSAAVRRRACAMGLEGIMCKRADAPYRPGRGRDWLKVKCQGREEFVVLGWTPPAGARTGFGALHLGYYDPEGALHYAGGVGSGFDAQELATLRKRLDALAAPIAEAAGGRRADRRCHPLGAARAGRGSPVCCAGPAAGACAMPCFSACAKTSRHARWCAPIAELAPSPRTAVRRARAGRRAGRRAS